MAAVLSDHNVSRRIADILRTHGNRIVLAGDLGMARANDEAILLFAAKRQLIVLTHDEDFILLHRAWRLWSADWGISRDHGGILTMEQVAADRAAAEVQALLQTVPVLTNRLYAWRPATGWVERS